MAYKKLKEEARYDGKFVLFTNTSLPTEEVATSYKSLWQIEYAFKNLKTVGQTFTFAFFNIYIKIILNNINRKAEALPYWITISLLFLKR